ncbi:hypothetical protein DL766_006066 [Monosporascus sp. MC13-8B]|uniref:Up-regulated during septation protein 1 domain-containing protein n=1 Tax=Monosporascus cannonballus TaxID=155416 RepID=A0ABY0GRQ7_9PEZI|nr:hypothetical protein DL762_010246 [Monosporascus cannonballus]RYO96216.1 hypothetical protein DL763_003343 [Monosporascus cannonballus]RYP28073.1 hypothetical protein DL766_006066 [Monosporascus sp. MC13-8B]
MAQPDTRRYQLFPKDRQLPAPIACGKQLEPEQPSSVAMGQTPEKSEQTSITNNLRQRIKEHNLNRRRKVSVPELGPMTTVQEVAMDSPTIPGRPALHERSISSPVQSTRYRHLATLRTIHQASKEDNVATHIAAPVSAFRQDRAPASNASRQPLSPKDLTPLVIPKQPTSLPQLAQNTHAFYAIYSDARLTPYFNAKICNDCFNLINPPYPHLSARGIPRFSAALGEELRYLDNRTEYLRRTYMSLRAGRRNLHSRICQYLRSARVAKFSYESMLKQEEALAELDASIDDWVNKLEQAENRRTRVRQKLLEHVAAAATLPNSANNDDTAVGTPLQKTIGVHRPSAASDLSTPPQSPTKMGTFFDAESPSSSPQRVVARVPSVIPELPAEEGESTDSKYSSENPEEESVLKRMESIRIYADSDLYALLADVENEFTNLNEGGHASPQLKTHPPTDEERRRELHRAHSHDVLSGGPKTTTIKSQPASPRATSPPAKELASGEGDIFLSAAVFKPE